MKKIDQGIQFLTDYMQLFQCPVCHAQFIEIKGHSLCCEQNHHFDVSKKGTVFFLAHQAKNEYDKEMLTSRFKIAQDGLFNPILDVIFDLMGPNYQGTTIDVGCGEGSQLDYLTEKGLKGTKIGFDISKDAIQLASSHFTSAFWCVADLAKSPFATNQYDTLLNIFSPSNYQEFKRILKDNGTVIKVVPEKNYLIELRHLFYQDQKEKQTYQNDLVIEKFQEHFPEMEQHRCSYEFPLNEEQFQALMEMTPLGWGASEEATKYALLNPLKMITVDVCILVGKKQIS
ncbi:50S rRNA methyltransferase [Carnobacterium divergens]|uniref:Methyltransferase domain-containing protein n=2 Tax=Carnobacterium divergens TaxID=2748 RepID=A0AAW8RB23_CARDV|nr:methyltransferase domain-containing protein [Carnobacterium divergens]ANZ99558.1 50S rRNA methyltransferase [Carnobacterium divergens]KRN56440.1 putative ribosomal RNA large subunit methyltransferase A [Carnobacterium divergens DSM 20623]MDO0874967.1 methyltransferase domain-containing protein [Carnobacterium divergens]MDT1958328.1 methyltransferase domain-containing protein [Carnobacterium divergens]MDT1974177.1 methyltransferase domain-containing protein [Carnobacterium divergens]